MPRKLEILLSILLLDSLKNLNFPEKSLSSCNFVVSKRHWKVILPKVESDGLTAASGYSIWPFSFDYVICDNIDAQHMMLQYADDTILLCNHEDWLIACTHFEKSCTNASSSFQVQILTKPNSIYSKINLDIQKLNENILIY